MAQYHDSDDDDRLRLLQGSETDLLIELADLADEIDGRRARVSIVIGQLWFVRRQIAQLLGVERTV